MTNVSVTRWRRYGKDRLYVKNSAGRDVGRVDVLTGKRTVNDAVSANSSAPEPLAEDAAGAEPAVADPQYDRA